MAPDQEKDEVGNKTIDGEEPKFCAQNGKTTKHGLLSVKLSPLPDSSESTEDQASNNEE